MKHRTTAFLVFLFVALLAPMVHADDPARRVTLRVMEPVEIPGHILQPGRYDLTLWDASNGVNFVRVSCHDQRCQYGWFAVEPVERRKAGDAEVDVAEPVGKDMERITEWFYPGEKEGYAFVYERHHKHWEQAAPSAQ